MSTPLRLTNVRFVLESLDVDPPGGNQSTISDAALVPMAGDLVRFEDSGPKFSVVKRSFLIEHAPGKCTIEVTIRPQSPST